MNKPLIIIGAAALAVAFSQNKGERSAGVNDGSVNSDVVDLLIQRVKTDADLQRLLRGTSGASAPAGKAKIEMAGLGLSYGGNFDGGVFNGGGAVRIDFMETAGFASRGDIFLKIEPVGTGSIRGSFFDPDGDDKVQENSGSSRFVYYRNSYWTAVAFTSDAVQELVFKIGGTKNKKGIAPNEHLLGVFCSVSFDDFTGEVGDLIGFKISVYGPQIEGFEHTVTEAVTAS